MSAEETDKDTAATATEEPTETPETETPANQPIPIERDQLTEDAKTERSGKPIPDIAYTSKGEEELPGCVRKISLEVAADDFKKELDKYYNSLRKEVVIPGFRKGKAPVNLIRIRMGKEADKEAMVEVATNALRQEVLTKEIEVVGNAQLVDWTLEQGQPLAFDAEVEVQPVIELNEYTGLKVEAKVPKSDVDKSVEERLSQMREEWATFEPADEKHELEIGDVTTVDIEVLGEDGKPLSAECAENKTLYAFHRDLPEEVVDELEGKTAGTEVEVLVDTETQNRRGESTIHTDTWKVTLKSIKVRTLPEMNDEWAKDIEYDSLDALKAEIREQTEKQIEQERRNRGEDEILKAIIEKNEFDVPRSIVSNIQYNNVMNQERYLRQMGISLSSLIQDPDEFFERQRVSAELIARKAYIFDTLKKAESLEASEEDLTKEIERMAEEQGRKPLAIRAKLEADRQLEDLKNSLVDKKVSDFLHDKNTVKYVEVEPEEEKPAGEEAEASDEGEESKD